MSFGGSKGAGPSGNVPDVLYSGVTSSPFGATGDLFGSMSPGTQTAYGGLEQQPFSQPTISSPSQVEPSSPIGGGAISPGTPGTPSTGPVDPSTLPADFWDWTSKNKIPFSLSDPKSLQDAVNKWRAATGKTTQYDPTPYRSAVAQATSDPSNLSASLTGGTTAGGNWNRVIGTEFGEVDNPKYGGYTEPNWNKGAWGDTISGWDTQGVALPNAPRGTVVEVLNPANGRTTTTTVIDKGPGASTGAGIDLTGGTRAALGLERNFKGPVQYRIVGGPGTPVPTSQVAAVSPPQSSQPLTPLTQPSQQQQAQKQQPKKPAAQQRPRRPRKRIAGITPSFQSPPAELTFLRQALGGLPYSQSQQPAEPDQTQES